MTISTSSFTFSSASSSVDDYQERTNKSLVTHTDSKNSNDVHLIHKILITQLVVRTTTVTADSSVLKKILFKLMALVQIILCCTHRRLCGS